MKKIVTRISLLLFIVSFCFSNNNQDIRKKLININEKAINIFINNLNSDNGNNVLKHLKKKVVISCCDRQRF